MSLKCMLFLCNLHSNYVLHVRLSDANKSYLLTYLRTDSGTTSAVVEMPKGEGRRECGAVAGWLERSVCNAESRPYGFEPRPRQSLCSV